MHPALADVDHRPWPLPERAWTMRQQWRDLLFAHWPLPVEAVRPLVPQPIAIDTFEGATWVGVVPFRMADVAPRGLPAVPGLSAFPELNLRLYVTYRGRPGVWFLSLDAANPIAVWVARRFFHLPYEHADMAIAPADGGFAYRSVRRGGEPVVFEARYGPDGDAEPAEPHGLTAWLTERYSLYAQSPGGTLYRGEIHHAPWPLQPAWAEITRPHTSASPAASTSSSGCSNGWSFSGGDALDKGGENGQCVKVQLAMVNELDTMTIGH